MTADQNFYDIRFTFFYPTASATAYGQRPKFVRAEHSATAEGENCAYGPTLVPTVPFCVYNNFFNNKGKLHPPNHRVVPTGFEKVPFGLFDSKSKRETGITFLCKGGRP